MRFWSLNRKLLKRAGLALLLALVCAWVVWPATGRWVLRERPVEPDAPAETGVAATEDREPVQRQPEIIVPARTDFFVEYRLEREMSRGRQIELLQSVAQDPAAGEAQRTAARDRLLQITRDLEREVGLENILKAKGFRDAVVFFQDGLVTVVVPEPLSETEATAVVNLVARGAGVAAENVMIVGHTAENKS